MAREEETVETVYGISCITDHRAEATVLMRTLRVDSGSDFLCKADSESKPRSINRNITKG